MLINFSLENVSSFKTAQNISMEASTLKKDSFLDENLIKNKDKNYVKTVLMYGANASGKTNFIKSISKLKRIVLSSHDLNHNFITDISPFLLATGDIQPSLFEVTFIENEDTTLEKVKLYFKQGFIVKSIAANGDYHKSYFVVMEKY